jgi:hypothetical protein
MRNVGDFVRLNKDERQRASGLRTVVWAGGTLLIEDSGRPSEVVCIDPATRR